MPLLAVNHHYFRTEKPGRGIYPTTPEQMRSNVATIRQQGWQLGTQTDILDFCNGSTDKKICVITFDDGLKEQMRCLELLESLGVSAMFFVSTAPMLSGRVLDVHKMHMIRTELTDEEVASRLETFGFSRYVFDMAVLATQYRYDTEISQKVKYFLNFGLDAEQKDRWTSETFAELFGDEKAVAKKLYMDAEDWKLLAKKHCLGTHGHRHVPLATLSPEGIADDLQASLDLIREKTGYAPKGMGYPFGGKTAVSEAVFSAAKAHGLAYGFTMQRGVNARPDNPMALNRIDVNDLSQYLS